MPAVAFEDTLERGAGSRRPVPDDGLVGEVGRRGGEDFQQVFRQFHRIHPAGEHAVVILVLRQVQGRTLQGLGSEVIVYEKEPIKLLPTPDGSRVVHHVITVDGRKTWLPKAALDRNLAGKIELINTNVPETPVGEKQTKPAAKGR